MRAKKRIWANERVGVWATPPFYPLYLRDLYVVVHLSLKSPRTAGKNASKVQE